MNENSSAAPLRRHEKIQSPYCQCEAPHTHQGSRIACYVIPTDEELMIARHTLRVLRAQATTLLEEKPA